MREIKFRYWCKSSKEMSKGFRLQETTGKENWGGLIPMQYTGLKDKNGKEIYEGDILSGSAIGNVVVKFGEYDNGESYDDWVHGNGWYVEYTHPNREYAHYDYISSIDMFDFNNRYEVIGNIYENGDLLEAGE